MMVDDSSTTKVYIYDASMIGDYCSTTKVHIQIKGAIIKLFYLLDASFTPDFIISYGGIKDS